MAVEIQLTDQYWLVSDTHSWAIAQPVVRVRKDKKTGKVTHSPEWKQLSWHLTVADACQACLERVTRESDVEDWGSLQELACRTAAQLRTATQCVDQYQTVGQGLAQPSGACARSPGN